MSGDPLDSNTTCFLFLFTVIIHVATMFMLNGVSCIFREYITAASGNADHPDLKTIPAAAVKIIPAAAATSCRVSESVQYRPLIRDLCDTLDVTVFR
jgi:hypothetical protein